jgi:aminodeoxyfutalosine deaminase
LKIYRAPWILPIATPPVRDGWIAVEDFHIAAVGGPEIAPPSNAIDVTVATSAILPAVVNAHTHLEFSWARGQVSPAASMPKWASDLISRPRPPFHETEGTIAAAIAEARRCGTTLVGDISNTLASYEPLLDSELSACVFNELLGFRPEDADRLVANAAASLQQLTPVEWLRCSIVPHAPFSVSPELFRAIAEQQRDGRVSVHLGESKDEIEFLRSGGGAWRHLLETLGVWTPSWTPPRLSPVDYLDQFGLVGERLLAVHGVQLTDAELKRLAKAGATVVTCPRSNRWTGAGDPPVSRFYASGVRVAIGTDSLASVEDLNLFTELAAVRKLAADVPARRILESATRSGADALGFGDQLGTIEPHKRAELIAVRIPAGLEDVEEYLLSGIQPEAIHWLSSDREPVNR